MPMTKTCPDCQATVHSSATPEQSDYEHDLIRRLRQHDGNLGFLVEEAADTLAAALAAAPAVGGEDARTEALRVISTMAICEEGETAEQRALIVDACREVAANALAAQPAYPLRGRESVREIAHRHCTCTCRDDPAVLQNHTNLCDEICDAILEYAVLSSVSPEQAAATPDIVKMYSDMERAKNARIGELEEALGKAVLSAPLERQLTENERDAIAHAKYQCDCSSPSDPEVRFDYEVIRTLLSLIPVPKEAT